MSHIADARKYEPLNSDTIYELARDTFRQWCEHKAPRLGAALAYYTIFSIGPLLVIAIAVASIVFKDAEEQIVSSLSGVLGGESAEVVKQTIESGKEGGRNWIATIIGIITLLIGASGVFGQLKDALNTIWEVKPKEGRGFFKIIKERFFSFTMVLGTGFLLLVSLIVTSAAAALTTWLRSFLPGGDILGHVVSVIVSFLLVSAIFALLFKYLPDVELVWKDVWIGAVASAVLFMLGQYLLSIYIASGAIGAPFGAVGSLVIVLVWIYYSAQILFLGAEFTQVYTHRFGSRVKPKHDAEFVTKKDKAQEGAPSSSSEDHQNRSDRSQAESEFASFRYPTTMRDSDISAQDPVSPVIRKYPGAAISFAFAFGGVLGWLHKRRHRDNE